MREIPRWQLSSRSGEQPMKAGAGNRASRGSSSREIKKRKINKVSDFLTVQWVILKGIFNERSESIDTFRFFKKNFKKENETVIDK